MNKLILQIIVRQWDKSQQSEQDIQTRSALPNRYPVNIPPAKSLFADRVIIDQHGDDSQGHRIQYQLVNDNVLLDRFRFDLNTGTVEFKAKLTADSAVIQLAKLRTGWQQFQYQWRYRVEAGGYIYWLYEDVTLNAGFTDKFSEVVFMAAGPRNTFKNLLN